MCDTLVAVGKATSDGSVIFAKNSDRDINEGHQILYFPRQTFEPDKDRVKTTYLEIPQVEETYAMILSSPYWMYGCEMGSNERGVTIGNEAVFTKEPERDNGLLGMDLIRLALERSKTASEALDTIISLLSKYGQGGFASAEHKIKYHNSFIIADLQEAWVLETADQYWIAEKVKNFRTISNTLTIGNKFDRIHPKLIDYAKQKGYCNSKKDFNFRNNFKRSFPDYRDWGAKGWKRHQITTNFLAAHEGNIDPATMMRILRNHNKMDNNWNPSKGSFECICLHIRPIFVLSQTTSSLVSHLRTDLQTHWMTGTAAPCTSLFKPFFLETGLINIGPLPTNKYNPETLWWKHELIHRSVLLDYETRIRLLQPDIQYYEEKWINSVQKLIPSLKSLTSDERCNKLTEISREAFNEALEVENKWLEDLKKVPVKNKSGGWHYRRLWKKESEKAGLKQIE